MNGILGYEQARPQEAPAPPGAVAPALNVRPVEVIYPHEAPEGPRQGDTPSRAAKMPIAVFNNAVAILAVMRDSFIPGGIYAPDFSAAVNYSQAAGQGSRYTAPWRERANINRLEPETFGSRVILDDQYQLLMGA